tara:strand:+ start:3354 stop:3620 length:267 start_codon:yes stop_codon:yes gene_type:complete
MSTKEVAEFMKAELDRRTRLYQEMVVYDIIKQFGKEFTYTNQNGNPAIDKKVLAEFKKITPDVVWERGDRCWRKKMPHEMDRESRAVE